MREVLERVRDLDLVLKGGSALAFAHGLGRHSTNLDFDGHGAVSNSGPESNGPQAPLVSTQSRLSGGTGGSGSASARVIQIHSETNAES